MKRPLNVFTEETSENEAIAIIHAIPYSSHSESRKIFNCQIRYSENSYKKGNTIAIFGRFSASNPRPLIAVIIRGKNRKNTAKFFFAI